MPEGPEIRRAADKVANAIVGKPIIKVSFGLEKLKQWESQLSASTVEQVETRGKAMLTRFASGLTIYSHNQLYGRWIITASGEWPETNRQLRLAIHTEDHSALLYSASDIAVLSGDELRTHPFLGKLGPDVLDPSLTSEQVQQRLQSKRFCKRQLGTFLTDQSFVAGLGNYLRCEILFVAGLSPKLSPSQLGLEQLDRLGQAILRLPRQSYETAGITHDLDSARQLMQQGHHFEDARFWVFRRAGLPCYRCNTSIQAKNMGGQNCYFCPTCQMIR